MTAAQEYLGLGNVQFNESTYDGWQMCLTCGAVVPRMFGQAMDGLRVHDQWHESLTK